MGLIPKLATSSHTAKSFIIIDLHQVRDPIELLNGVSLAKL